MLPRSDGADEFCEDRYERMPSIDVRAEFVVASTKILDKRVSGTDHRAEHSRFRLRIGRSRAFRRP